MMAVINRMLRRRHVIAPCAGQIWRSEHSGRAILVSEVEISDYGTTIVSVKYERDGFHDFNSIQTEYAFSLAAWRRNIRDEARVLEDTLHSYPSHPLPPVPHLGDPPCN